jgi:hypothetical protein
MLKASPIKKLASKHGLLIPAELAKGANQVEISSKKPPRKNKPFIGFRFRK